MPSVSRAVRAWPSRWFTARRGLRATSASAFAVVRPTISPPISPGPAPAAVPANRPADRPGPGRGGDPVDVLEPHLRLVQRALDQMVERLDMGPSRDLR